MTERELSGLIENEVRSATGYLSGELTEERRKAMEYYLGEPFGNEVEGRSQVVSTDVADTIEWILPSLLKIFTAGDDVVAFEPHGPEDEEVAKQATEYVNWIFNKDNPGFLILYSVFKDALLQKNGVAKIWWEEIEDDDERTVYGVDPDSFALAQADPDIEITAHTANEDGSHDYKYRKSGKNGKVCVVPVPPEEFLINRRARSIAEARYVGHRVRKTLSDLIAEGYPRAKVESLSGDDDAELNDEAITRREFEETSAPDAESIDKSMREVWVVESYVKVDWDGDGIAEMRQVTSAGNGATILKNEEWDGPAPFISVTPVIMPHRFVGLSIADLVMDLQLIKSTILRQILDNLYLANNGRHVISDQVNLDDLLTSRPGGVVRLKGGAMPGQGHVMPLETPLVANQAFPMLEYLDTIRENRTGVTRYNQGLDANSLNKTATGISQIMTAAQQRIELIARIFAETGIKDMFRLILGCVTKYQSQPRVIRLRGQWVPMDPRGWESEFDLTVNVGLGTGDKDQMLAHLYQILQMQVQAIQFQGDASGPLVTLQNVFHTLSKVVENAGLKGVENYFSDPSGAPPKPPKPDPKMLEVQSKLQLEQAKLGMEKEKTAAQLQLEREKAAADLNLEWAKLNAEMQLKQTGMAAEQQMKREGMVAENQFKRESADMELRASGERFDKELEARKGRDSMEIKAGMGISPDNEKLDGIEQALGQLLQVMSQVVQRQEQGMQAVLQAVSAPKQIAVQRDESGRIVGATAAPTIQ